LHQNVGEKISSHHVVYISNIAFLYKLGYSSSFFKKKVFISCIWVIKAEVSIYSFKGRNEIHGSGPKIGMTI